MGPIGVDLDNTIISYDGVLYEVASELGLIGPEVGAQCVSSACWDLCGRCRVTGIPTAT